jgi:hypothetical protein
MKRWVESDAERLRPQEMALLALCDRMTTVEQLVTVHDETYRTLFLEQARLLTKQREALAAQRASIQVLEDRLHRMELILAGLS